MDTNDEPSETGPETFDNLQQAVKWNRQYAQNRSLPALFHLIFLGVSFAILGIAFAVVGNTYRAGALWSAGSLLTVTLTFEGALLWLCCTRKGQTRLLALYERAYAGEGHVEIKRSGRGRPKWLGHSVGICLALCLALSVCLGLAGYISETYAQPVSAVYLVPFLVFLVYWEWPRISLIFLLWPALYALHALVLVSGLPIPKEGNWVHFHLLFSAAGYGIIAMLASHVYSRYALRKVRRLTQAGLTAATSEMRDDE